MRLLVPVSLSLLICLAASFPGKVWKNKPWSTAGGWKKPETKLGSILNSVIQPNAFGETIHKIKTYWNNEPNIQSDLYESPCADIAPIEYSITLRDIQIEFGGEDIQVTVHCAWQNSEMWTFFHPKSFAKLSTAMLQSMRRQNHQVAVAYKMKEGTQLFGTVRQTQDFAQIPVSVLMHEASNTENIALAYEELENTGSLGNTYMLAGNSLITYRATHPVAGFLPKAYASYRPYGTPEGTPSEYTKQGVTVNKDEITFQNEDNNGHSQIGVYFNEGADAFSKGEFNNFEQEWLDAMTKIESNIPEDFFENTNMEKHFGGGGSFYTTDPDEETSENRIEAALIGII